MGNRLKTYFIENGLMRKDEPQRIVSLFKDLGVTVDILDAKKDFFKALRGITDPEEKGDFVPEGLLGEDAVCFDIEEWDEELIRYIEVRLDEACRNASGE